MDEKINNKMYLKFIVLICIVSMFSMAVVCGICTVSMYYQSRNAEEQATERVRLYFETDYDYVNYPDIEMTQEIGGNE